MAKKKKLRSVNLGRFTADYVAARKDALVQAAVSERRNERMERYEAIYDMRMWLDAPTDGEKRVTTPLGFSTVQQMVALLFTRQYTVNIPVMGMGAKASDKAQKKEKYLYGVTDLAGLRAVIRDAAWSAACRGLGVVKQYYRAKRYADEFPLAFTAPDPKTLYFTLDTGRTRFKEVAQTWPRSRREVETEWGVELTRPTLGFDDAAQEQVWLDGECEYTEYWTEESAEEEREKEMPEDMAVDKGVMEMVQPPGMQGMQGMPDMMGGMKPEAGSPNEEDQNDNLAEGDGEAESETKAAPKRAKKEIVLVRKIVHTVVVEDTAEAQVIKKAVVLPGYTRIPFYFWAGQRTPRAGSKGALSVLYALTNGDADPQTGGLGVLQTINELLSLDITIATRFANPPAMTDDEDLIPDTAPGAMNQVRPGRKGLWFVEHPGAPPDVARLTQEMRNEASRVTIPEVLSGQYVSASGQALGIMSSVFDQTLGFAQQDAESALSAMYAQTLELTEYYADPDYGWKVWGSFKRKDFEDWIKPEDIDGDYRVRVRLSSNLPRDMIAMLQTYASLAKGPKPLISMDTFLDLFQKLTDAGADTPVEEKSRILAEMGLFDGPMAKMLGESLGQEYAPLLGVPLPPAAPQPQPQPQGAPSMPGGQSITPDMVAAMGNVQGAMNMQGGPGAQPPGLAGMMGQ